MVGGDSGLFDEMTAAEPCRTPTTYPCEVFARQGEPCSGRGTKLRSRAQNGR